MQNSYLEPETCLHEISYWSENLPEVESFCFK